MADRFPHQLQAGYVLHRRPWRDNHLIVQVLTPDWGKVSLLAHGAGHGRSQRHQLLQPLRPLLFSWKGDGELATLTNVEAVASTHPFDDLASTWMALYLNELLVKLLYSHQPAPILFQQYQFALQALATKPDERVLRNFELHLLQELGVVLDHDSHGKAVAAERHYQQSDSRLYVVTAASSSSICGATLLALHRGEVITAAEMADLKRLMRGVLQNLLGDRPLLSRTIFQQIAQQRQLLPKTA